MISLTQKHMQWLFTKEREKKKKWDWFYTQLLIKKTFQPAARSDCWFKPSVVLFVYFELKVPKCTLHSHIWCCTIDELYFRSSRGSLRFSKHSTDVCSFRGTCGSSCASSEQLVEATTSSFHVDCQCRVRTPDKLWAAVYSVTWKDKTHFLQPQF